MFSMLRNVRNVHVDLPNCSDFELQYELKKKYMFHEKKKKGGRDKRAIDGNEVQVVFCTISMGSKILLCFAKKSSKQHTQMPLGANFFSTSLFLLKCSV